MEKKRVGDYIIIGLSLALCIIGLMGIPRLHVDSSTDAFIPLDAPVVKTNEEIEDIFGSLDALVVSLKSSTTMLDDEHLKILGTVTEKIEKLDGVKQISSLANMQHLEQIGRASCRERV